VDPVPDPLLLKNLVAPGIEPETSGSVARNSDHYTTEVVSGKKNPMTSPGIEPPTLT
jgi:hypothetical protein